MDFKQTAGCLSFALYWAWVFSTIIGSSLLPGLDEQASQCVRMVGSFGIAAGLAFQYASLPRISILDSRLITCAVVVFPVAYGALLFASSVAAVDVPAYVLGCTLFLAAAASSLLLCGIGGGFAMYRRRYGIITTALASTLGALLSVLVSVAAVEVSVICVATLIPLATALFRAAHLVPAPETMRDRRCVREQIRAYRALLFFMLMYGMTFGLAVSAGADASGASTGGVALLVAICLPGMIVLLLLVASKVRVDVESLQRVLLALAVVGVGALSFAGGDVQVIALLFLAVCFGVFDIASFVSLFEIIRENGLPHLSTFALGRLPSELGIALGWALGFVLSQAFPGMRAPALAALVVAACIVLGLALFGRRPPVLDSAVRGGDEVPASGGSVMGGSAATTGADAGGAAAFAESAGSRALGVGHAAGSPEGLDAVSARVDRALDPRLPADFKKAKAAIAAECALSPREVEVFDLLATGRSPKRISEKLFVSESTVKSHCYRIYRKMGIHSQQELLDVVEDRVEQLLDNRWKLIP